jgi:hypothetical protein
VTVDHPEDDEAEVPPADGDGFDAADDEVFAAGELDGDDAEEDPQTALPPKMEAWRRRSATGAILTGFALGLQAAFEKEHEQPAIVMVTSGDPPRDLPVEAEVEGARPRQSVVSIRPWLLTGSPSTEPDDGEAPEEEPEPGDG